jgi:hypothetical protein
MMGRLRVVAAHVVVVAEGHPALAAGEAIAEHPRGTLACLLPEVEALTIAEQQHRTAEAVGALSSPAKRKRPETITVAKPWFCRDFAHLRRTTPRHPTTAENAIRCSALARGYRS